ncbi:MAG: cupin domain-containing protein [Synergistaceae bacterium]|jgi:mannose-6-phosphate isomerase-like protein (cupin superfamily)|nr:cupin domain-containing protein [Synergistaceae bacterium]
MIFSSNSLEKVTAEKARGGEGSMQCRFAFQMGKAPEGSAFQVLASQTLTPGSSVGYHQHTENEELYVILSGNGTFYDDGNVSKPVGPGDMTLTLKGQSHGLANTGTEPLVFLAAIAKN